LKKEIEKKFDRLFFGTFLGLKGVSCVLGVSGFKKFEEKV